MKRRAGFAIYGGIVAIGVTASVLVGGGFTLSHSTLWAKIRNAQRIANAQVILTAIYQNIVDHRGVFTCSAGEVPKIGGRVMRREAQQSETSSGDQGYDIAPCLVPHYLASLPFDMTVGHWSSPEDYNTGYQIGQDSRGPVVIVAPNAELAELIIVAR